MGEIWGKYGERRRRRVLFGASLDDGVQRLHLLAAELLGRHLHLLVDEHRAHPPLHHLGLRGAASCAAAAARLRLVAAAAAADDAPPHICADRAALVKVLERRAHRAGQ